MTPSISITKQDNGYVLKSGSTVIGIHKTAWNAATALKSGLLLPSIASPACNVSLPPEVLAFLTANVKPSGARRSVYLSAQALLIVHQRREETGESLSAAISALILDAP